MPMARCPVCAKSISSEAATCPNCGHPIIIDEVTHHSLSSIYETLSWQKEYLRSISKSMRFFVTVAIFGLIGLVIMSLVLILER